MDLTKDEIRKLVGGYATGSLTEAERKLLLDAALDDQDLFDELMAEQQLKALLDTPGAKPRLIRAVAPEKRRSVWAWGAVAGLAAAALLVWLLPRAPEPQPEIAAEPVQVARMEAPAAPPPETESAPAPVRAAKRAAPPEKAEKPEQPERDEARADALGPPPPTADPAPVAVVVPPPAKPLAQAPPPPPPPAEEPKVLAAAAETVTVTADAAPLLRAEAAAPADAITPTQAKQLPVLPLGAAAGKGGAQGKQAPALAAARIAPGVAEDCGLTYALTGRSLRLTALVPGVLLVSAQTPAGPVTVFPRNPVVSGLPIVLTIVDAATEVTVAFAAQEGIPPAANAQRVTALAGTLTGPRAQELRFSIPVAPQ